MKFKTSPLLIIILLCHVFQVNGYKSKVDSVIVQMFHKSIDYRDKYEYDKAIELLIETEKKLTAKNYDKYKPQILSHLIYLYDEKGEFSNAITAGKLLLEFNNLDSTLLSLAITNLGVSYNKIGEKSIALDYFLKAQKIHLAIGDYKELHFNYSNIAMIYRDVENYEQALNNYHKAIETAKKYRQEFLTNYYKNISRVYSDLANFELARQYLDSSFFYANYYNNKKEQGIVLDDYGDFFFLQEMYDSALFYYDQSLNIKLTIDRINDQLQTVSDISKTQHELHQYAKAIELSNKGFEKAVRIKDNLLIRDFSKNLFNSFYALQDYKNAIKYHLLHKTYYDSLVNEEKTRDLLRTQIRYETEQKDAENQSLKQHDIISQQTIKSQNRFMMILTSGILIFMIIAIIIYRAFILNKRLSNKVQLQSDKLKELDEAKSRFFANISHDLRTPLTLIMGSIEQVLADKEVFLSNKAEKLLHTGYANGDRIIDLTKEINELIQLEDGKLKLFPKPIDIIKYLEVLIGMFHSAAELKTIDLQFINKLDANVTPAYINLDTKQFEKVMYNLVSNAFKHTPAKGSIHIILSDQNEANYTIVVKDSGEGIPTKNIPYIFDRYYQTPNTTYKTHEGFGLGLALVKEIVSKHGGKTWVTSVFGQGSEFGINLKKITNSGNLVETEDFSDMPYIKEKQKVFGALENLVTKGNPLVTLDIENNPEQSEIAVLIVDDHPEIRAYIKDIIETKYKVLEAVDGQKALEILAKEQVAIIITDLMMPFFDGFELLKKLREDEKLKTIPALVVSARTTDEDKRKVLSSGINDFLSKPFNAQELLQRIENLLRAKETWNNSNEDAIFINNKTNLDDAQKSMIKKVESLILDKIDDPNLSVLDLANELIASERQVYRMIKKLTELTPFEYIKEVRWQYVQYLFKNNKVSNSSEAARNIGMNNVSHFKAQYKKRFGSEPSFDKN